MSAILPMPAACALAETASSIPCGVDGAGLLAGGTLFTGMLAGALAIPGTDQLTTGGLLAAAPTGGTPATAPEAASEESSALSAADGALLAQILQAMGIQVSAQRLATLTPLEMQQVESALDFAASQLATGRYAPEDVLEEAEVLLPQGLAFSGLPLPVPTTGIPAASRESASAKAPAFGSDPAVLAPAMQATPEAGAAQASTVAFRPAARKADEGGNPVGVEPAELPAPSPEEILALVDAARRLLGQGTPAAADAASSRAPGSAPAPAAPVGRPEATVAAKEGVEEEVEAAVPAPAGDRPATAPRHLRGRAEPVSAAPAAPAADSRAAGAPRPVDASAAPSQAAIPAPSNPEPPQGVRLLRQAFEESLQAGFDAGIRASRTAENSADIVRESAPPAFRPGSPASEMVARQVFDGMHVLLTEGRDEMRMSLWPENLGRVSVRLKIEDGERVDVRVLVQSDSVKQALDAAIPTLRETLSRQGLELGSLSVSVGGKDRGGEPGDPGGQGDPRRSASRRGAELEDAVASRAPLLRGIDTGWRNGRNSIDVLL